MDPIERLKRDHTLLRAKLNVLEAALRMGPETWFVLREVCFTLSRQLQHHIRREEDLIASGRNALDPQMLGRIALEHRDEPGHLRTLNRLFGSEATQSLESVRPVLTQIIQGLRRHMAEEEQVLFPQFARVLAGPTTLPAMPEAPLPEDMTVNRVIQQFPQSRMVFERLFISVPIEGCNCLDEVAWRHGMEVQELLRQLAPFMQKVSDTFPALKGV